MENQKSQESQINAFLEAVNYLFHSNDKDLKVKANKFLVEFESKPESWDISYQVLLKDNLPEEVYYNALNILKNKIKYDFGNYTENPEYIEKLLSFFYENIDKFKKMKNYILINYCDCIGKAFLFTYDKFNDLLQKFTMKLSGQNADIESLLSLLLIFNFICETNFDKRMVIDNNSKLIFTEHINKIVDDVLKFLVFMINKLNTIDNDNLKHFIQNQILETINNYLYIEFGEEIILKFSNEYLPIINFIFQIDDENLDKHGECICSLLNLPLQENNMRNLAQIIFSKILQFKEILNKSFESIDDEQASFYIEVFTSMVGNNLDELLKENRIDFLEIIVELIKKCPSNKIMTIVDFFCYFNDYLIERQYKINDVMNDFKNLFLKIILNFINLTKFDDQIFAKLNITKTKALKNDDEYNKTLDYREAAKEILIDFIKNYGLNFIFDDLLFPEFVKVVNKIKENQTNLNSWCKMENLLFIFSCICNYSKTSDKNFSNVIILFHTMLEIPSQYIQIIRIVTDILDNCSSILSQDKDLLLKGFKFLLNGLDNDLVIKYCSVSAKNLLKHNREIMSELRKDFMNLYENKLKNNILNNDKNLFIVEGIIYAVTFCKKENEQNGYAQIKSDIIQIFNQWVLYIQKAKGLLEANNNLTPEQNNEVNKLLIILKSISSSAFESLIMRGLVNDFIKFIPEYVKCIINGYKISPISSYLYGFEILVTVFPNRKEKELVDLLNGTFNELCTITFNSYIKNKSDLDVYTQIGEDFYGMLYRTMKQSPPIVLKSQILEDLINISLNFITTSQIEIAKNIIIFLKYFIKFQQSDRYKDMYKIDQNEAESCKKINQYNIEKFSSTLCQKILQIYINSSIKQINEEVTNLFEIFIFCQKPLVIKGMNTYLQECPNDILTNKEKKHFMNLIQECTNNELEEFLNNFINRCINKQIRNRGQN